MRLSDLVCTLDQAKTLENNGLPLGSVFVYTNRFKERAFDIVKRGGFVHRHLEEYDLIKVIEYPAYTAAELGVLLPHTTIFGDITYKKAKDVGYIVSIGNKAGFTYTNLAETMANALIWLIENDFVKPSELKL